MPEKIDIKADKRVFKGSSHMGPKGGPITSIECADGKVTRIRPYHYDENRDFQSLNPWKMEGHGKAIGPTTKSLISPLFYSYKKRIYSKNRVPYPLKRVDWDPKGERHPENRGKSKYVRISWDEAAQIIADELNRMKETYGMSAVLAENDMHGEGKKVAPSHGCTNRLLGQLGGYSIQHRNQDSWEGWFWGAKNVWGCEPVGEMTPFANIFPDMIENTRLMLFWGCDPETTPLGIDGMMASRLCYFFSEIGIECIYVDPALNFGAAVHADKWIPVLPNTDAALRLGMIYVWLTEGLYNKEYVETHAVGFEPFFDYVLGKEDGIPKDPKWASGKCGVPSYTIKAFARHWAKTTTSIMHGNGGPGIRGPFCTEPARLEAIQLGMQGLGAPGVHQAKMIEWNLFQDLYPIPYQGDAYPLLTLRAENQRNPGNYVFRGHFTPPSNTNESPDLQKMMAPSPYPPDQMIPRCRISDAILEDHIEWYGLRNFNGPAWQQFEKFSFPGKGFSRIHMIWTDSPCNVTCWNDGFRFVKAMQSPEIECVVAQHPWLENDCLLADIILPVCTQYEMEDIGEDTGCGIFTSVYHARQACDVVGEAKNDFDCVAEVAKKLGKEYYMAYTDDEMPVERVIEAFYFGSGVAHMDKDDAFHKDDVFVQPSSDTVLKDVPPGLRGFHDDPEKNPLTTPTGKLEFTSTELLRLFPDDQSRPPYPKWIERSELHDESLFGDRAKTYPLLLMSNHGRWRMHANSDDVTWTREIRTMKVRAKDGYQYEPMWISPETAASRGIEDGDIVKIYNERGTVLAGAYVTERLVPGAVYIDHGSRFDPIDPKGIDRGGCINLISPNNNTAKNIPAMVVSGFLVDVQKVTDEEMNEWKEKFPESFARKRDKDCGLCVAGWLTDED